MKRTSKKLMSALVALAVAGAVVIAGCGGGGSSSSSGSASSGSNGGEANAIKASGSGGGGTIGTTSIEGLGTVLVDSSGMTVYEFTVDEGTTSNCYGGCAAAWPPVIAAGKPTAGEGATASALGTTKRKDGKLQVTYDGHPLYTFAGDSAPGQANGNEAEGTWFVLDEGGAAVKGQAAEGASESEPASEEESSGGGYGY